MSANPPLGGWPPQQPQEPGRWRKLAGFTGRHRLQLIAVFAAAVIAGVAATVLISFSGSGSPQPVSYLCYNGQGDDGAMLLTWQPQGSGVISGVVHTAVINGTAPSELVSTDSGALEGQLTGTSLSVGVGGSTIYGRLAGGKLTLNVPQQDGTIQPVTCHTVSGNARWNQAIEDLNSSADSANATANQQQAQQAQAQASASAAAAKAQQVSQLQQSLSSDIGTLAQDAANLDGDSSLAHDIQSMKNDLATVQSDYATVQNDTCSSGNRGGDADTVNGDADTVSGDLDTLNGDITSLQNNNVSSDISAVKSDVSQLQSLGASPATDPSAALSAGHKALQDMNSAISWAQQQGKSINQNAQQIASAAQSLAAQCGG